MAAFLTQDAYDQFTLSKEEYELAKELKKENKKDGATKDGDKDESKKEEKPKDIAIEWDDLDDRTVRLTRNSANITQSYLLKDSSKLYFIESHADRGELWMRDFREDEMKLVKKVDGSASFELSADEKTIFILSKLSLIHI